LFLGFGHHAGDCSFKARWEGLCGTDGAAKSLLSLAMQGQNHPVNGPWSDQEGMNGLPDKQWSDYPKVKKHAQTVVNNF